MSGHGPVVALLLSDGANISMNREGSTFLDLALQKHHKHVCLAAIEHERWREVLAAPSLHYPTEFFAIVEEMPEIAKVCTYPYIHILDEYEELPNWLLYF